MQSKKFEWYSRRAAAESKPILHQQWICLGAATDLTCRACNTQQNIVSSASCGKVFRQVSTLLENSSPIFKQHEMLSLPRFGHFPARETAAGKLAAPSGTLLDLSSKTATAFLTSSDRGENRGKAAQFANQSACDPGQVSMMKLKVVSRRPL